ncbi:MAG: hypothetical protein M3220_00760 [Chloroflexota bacterium]|nr:hypothetical protein [Chloroflexota bacterium]
MSERRQARVWRVVRALVPLLAVALVLLAGPTLLAWWILGGPFGSRHLVIGLAITLALLLVIALLFGWAIGRLRERP